MRCAAPGHGGEGGAFLLGERPSVHGLPEAAGEGAAGAGGHRHGVRQACRHRPGLHRGWVQRDHRKAHRPVHRRCRRHRSGGPGEGRGGLRQPPEPVQQIRPVYSQGPGGGALREAVPRGRPRALEPGEELLRSGTLAGHLGSGRGLPHEPVYPQHRPAALDDG